MSETSQEQVVESAVRQWIETMIVGLNLCPFAGREVRRKTIRFTVTDARTEDDLLAALFEEFRHLDNHPETETSLLIHPQALADFTAYNQFLNMADALLAGAGLEGTYQIASFHPAYRFAGTDISDPENYTNRSPYPLLHVLRESSVEAAAQNADVEAIPERNIALMNKMGNAKLEALLKRCLAQAE